MYAAHSPDQTYIGWENNTWNVNRGEELKIRPERERIKIKKKKYHWKTSDSERENSS